MPFLKALAASIRKLWWWSSKVPVSRHLSVAHSGVSHSHLNRLADSSLIVINIIYTIIVSSLKGRQETVSTELLEGKYANIYWDLTTSQDSTRWWTNQKKSFEYLYNFYICNCLYCLIPQFTEIGASISIWITWGVNLTFIDKNGKEWLFTCAQSWSKVALTQRNSRKINFQHN